jgi:hypothetical protein
MSKKIINLENHKKYKNTKTNQKNIARVEIEPIIEHHGKI